MNKIAALLVVVGVLLIGIIGAFFVKIERSPVDNLEETSLRITFTGEFEILHTGEEAPHLSWVAIQSLNYPEESAYQEVIDFGASEPYTVKTDEWGNHYAILNFSNPVMGVNTYKIWSSVKVKRINTKEMPTEIEIIPAEFMNPNDMVQSSNARVKETAESIVQESKSQYSKVEDITNWVHEYLTYDSAVEDDTLDAVWTLENQRGVCVEYSHLAEALLRSIDIPARHVYGAAPYSFPSGWQEHTWIEAFIGKWVPMDPTWGETSFIDPAHVTFARVPDQTAVEEKVSVSGRNLEMGYMKLPEMTVEILDEKRGKEPVIVNIFGKRIKVWEK